MSERIERFVYDDDIVRKFMVATVVWGLVGMLVGLWWRSSSSCRAWASRCPG